MKKFTSKMSNQVEQAKWNKCNHIKQKHTTNSVISPSVFKRECAEFDAGTLPPEHELYIGERCV